MKYTPTIGIEIHVQLNTISKMFCGSKNADEEAPNSHTCPICMGHPGTLPVLNKAALDKGVMAALALEAAVQPTSKFDRKHYFYPDLPKGYQISQYDEPLAKDGKVTIHFENKEKEIRIERLHLEEDSAKMTHMSDGTTVVDFNRSGAPLAEIVSKPDMHSASEAKLFAQTLRTLLIYAEVTDGNMKKGHMRFDVNVSLALPKSKKLGKRVEIKNINSFKGLEQAIEYEIRRQSKLLDEGGEIVQETRGWDDDGLQTISQRSKEEAQDYRYFPEPDLPPLTFTQAEIKSYKKRLPELPHQKMKRFEEEYGLKHMDATMLINNPEISNFFEHSMSELQEWFESVNAPEDDEKIWKENGRKLTRLVLGWLTTELARLMNAQGITIKQQKITPENFGEFITLIYENKVNSTAAQTILKAMFETGIDPSHAMQEMNLEQVSDEGELEGVVDEVLHEEDKTVQDYKNGKQNALMYLVGKVMKKMKGKANPKMVTDILKKKLK